jgi:hypothetical protein
MSTQYRLVQSEKTASDGCSAGQGSSELQRLGFFFVTDLGLLLFMTATRLRSGCFTAKQVGVLLGSSH